SNAVARSTTHPIGGSRVTKGPMASETPAMTKAKAICFLENLRVFEDGASEPLSCLMGFGGDGVIVAIFYLERPRRTPQRGDGVGAGARCVLGWQRPLTTRIFCARHLRTIFRTAAFFTHTSSTS